MRWDHHRMSECDITNRGGGPGYCSRGGCGGGGHDGGWRWCHGLELVDMVGGGEKKQEERATSLEGRREERKVVGNATGCFVADALENRKSCLWKEWGSTIRLLQLQQEGPPVQNHHSYHRQSLHRLSRAEQCELPTLSHILPCELC